MAAPTTILTNKYSSQIFDELESTSVYKLIFNEVKALVYWWYVTMPVWYVLSLRRILTIIDDQYSISLLLSHFFTPWHRDFTFVGYFIGVIMKLLFLPVGFFVIVTTLGLYLLFLVFWFAIPIITILGILFTPFLDLIP
ncbi:hypothetical protein IT417_02380 [bacterium]|nr:hypothetical protein [bacterium]